MLKNIFVTTAVISLSFFSFLGAVNASAHDKGKGNGNGHEEVPVYTPPVCTPGQSLVEYFNNPTLEGTPDVATCEAFPTPPYIFNQNWEKESPIEGIKNKNFSIRYTSQISLIPGTYSLLAITSDEIRVLFNDQVIIETVDSDIPVTTTYVSTGEQGVGKVEYTYAGKYSYGTVFYIPLSLGLPNQN